MQPLVFRSRVDAWLGAILIGAIVVTVTVAIMAAWRADARPWRWSRSSCSGAFFLCG